MVRGTTNVAPWQPCSGTGERWSIPVPSRLLSVPLTSSVERGAIVGQLSNEVGALNPTHCLQFPPLPTGAKVPSEFLFEAMVLQVAVPHAYVVSLMSVTLIGRLLVFLMEKLKAPPGPG